jgi:multiple antibiotic resistance protein
MVERHGMIEFNSVEFTSSLDIFLLLLIGIGPKIALVPFLKVTGRMDDETKRRVTRKMLSTAAVVALILIVFGGLLTRLLHFSTGALGAAGGTILLIDAVAMVLRTEDPKIVNQSIAQTDPMKVAGFPLAVPYLLNPAGIVVLVTASAEAESAAVVAVVLVALALVLAIDAMVFHWANRLGEHLNEDRMVVTEKVFGFLLAALGVQLILDGLSDVGAIHLTVH